VLIAIAAIADYQWSTWAFAAQARGGRDSDAGPIPNLLSRRAPPMRVFEDEPQGPVEPPIDFWEHRLELPAKRILEDAAQPDFMEEWIKRRKPRQVAMLRALARAKG
jgi:hypothetical protein